MGNKVITTTSGYTVTLKPFLTYDQFIELQKLYTRDTFIDPSAKDKNGNPKAPDLGKIPANIIYEANKLALSFLVVSIYDAEGKTVERLANELPLPIADGQEVTDAINAVQSEASDAFGQKKVTTA